MSLSIIIALTILLIAALVGAFVLIARRGRALRTSRPLPPTATHGSLERSDGTKYPVEIRSPFYVGKSADSNIVMSKADYDYEICIFYHRQRFAFQTPSGVPGIRVNGEEQLAGYLFDGDVLTIAGESFTFHYG